MFKRVVIVVFVLVALVWAFENNQITTLSEINKTSQKIETPFDVNEVIKQVRHNPMTTNGEKTSLNGEFLVDTTPVYIPEEDEQMIPAVAFDGTNYLVVWSDTRNGNSDIYGCRVSQNGLILDPGGINLSRTTNNDYDPAVAFDGTNFLVVWVNEYTPSTDNDIVGLLVSPTGGFESGVFYVTPAIHNQLKPAVAFDGTNYLVVYQDNDPSGGSDYDIIGRLVGTTGSSGTDIVISDDAGNHNQEYPAVAYDSTHYFVAWEDYRNGATSDIYGCRVLPDGTVMDGVTTGKLISNSTNAQADPVIAFDGTNYLVVWWDYRNGAADIYGSRVDTAGTRLDGADGFAISTATNHQYTPSISFDGTNYIVVWDDWRISGSNKNIYGARVTPSASVLDPSGVLISSATDNQIFAAVAFDGTNYLVVWQDYRSGSDNDIYGCRVEPTTPTVLEPDGFLISAYVNAQYYPAVAFDGTNYLVVWRDNHAEGDIFGMHVDASGNPLDPEPIEICHGVNDQSNPAVAFDGLTYLVVWHDYRSGGATSFDIYGRYINTVSGPPPPPEFSICTAGGSQQFPSVTYDGANYLVVWQDQRSGNWDIYGSQVSTSFIVGPSFIITSEAAEQSRPDVCFGGSYCLVTWQDKRTSNFSIFGSRVNLSGVVQDPSGIAISSVSGDQKYPKIAYDGTNWLVVWHDYRDVSGKADIYGVRISQTGALVGSDIAICTHADHQFFPDVAFDGSNYVVAWTDNRSGSEYDFYGAKVTTGGSVFSPVLISNYPGDESYTYYSVALAKGSGGQVLVTFCGYAGTVNDKGYKTNRIWGKFFESQGWAQQTNIPGTGGVKDGGSLVEVYPYNSDAGIEPALYAFRGNKSNEFYRYNGAWSATNTLESLPYGIKYPTASPPKINKKKIGKGASLCYDLDHTIYATRGNSTIELWAYDILADAWTAKCSVPTVKKLKGGTSMACDIWTGHIYLLAGGQRVTDPNFFDYNPTANSWAQLTSAPIGTDNKPFKDGSCIIPWYGFGFTFIYALKGGAKVNEFYKFDGATWNSYPGDTIPVTHPQIIKKKNKIKDGAAMAYDIYYGYIYAIKGGGKQDFWRYTAGVSGSWVGLETIPRLDKKSVPKTGAALVYSYDARALYLLKGNKTSEFWKYTPAEVGLDKVNPSTRTAVMSDRVLIKPMLNVTPNPFTKLTTINYTVPISGKVTIKLFNTTGRLVQTLNDGFLKAGTYTTNLSANTLAKGVYFLRYETDDSKHDVKLIVQ